MGKEEPFESIHGFSSLSIYLSIYIYKLAQEKKTVLKKKRQKQKKKKKPPIKATKTKTKQTKTECIQNVLLSSHVDQAKIS